MQTLTLMDAADPDRANGALDELCPVASPDPLVNASFAIELPVRVNPWTTPVPVMRSLTNPPSLSCLLPLQ